MHCALIGWCTIGFCFVLLFDLLEMLASLRFSIVFSNFCAHQHVYIFQLFSFAINSPGIIFYFLYCGRLIRCESLRYCRNFFFFHFNAVVKEAEETNFNEKLHCDKVKIIIFICKIQFTC